jgi:membrane-associated HD superfamily phosphohydrolase
MLLNVLVTNKISLDLKILPVSVVQILEDVLALKNVNGIAQLIDQCIALLGMSVLSMLMIVVAQMVKKCVAVDSV